MKFAQSWTPASMDARKSSLSGARLCEDTIGLMDAEKTKLSLKLGML